MDKQYNNLADEFLGSDISGEEMEPTPKTIHQEDQAENDDHI